MSDNWITTAEAVKIVSKHSHHLVSSHHIQMLVNRGKIGTRPSSEGIRLLKLSDVDAIRVAAGVGSGHHRARSK